MATLTWYAGTMTPHADQTGDPAVPLLSRHQSETDKPMVKVKGCGGSVLATGAPFRQVTRL